MRPRTLIELCRARAETRAERVLYRFSDGARVSETLSFAELDRAARCAAAFLRERCRRGDRVLLMLERSSDFVRWFFGCQYAGVIAVPMNMPVTERQLATTRAIARNAEARLLLTSAVGVKLLGGDTLGCTQIDVTLDPLASQGDEAFVDVAVAPDSPAFLQYTSGSTGTPKGVIVSQANIVANLDMIQRGFAAGDHTVVMGWLPFTHDMGLVGIILEPLHLGVESILMPPMAFVRRPVRWLELISQYRVTDSGGPDFAYAMCVRRIDDSDMAGIDLSSWRLAFNGAETVRPQTLEAFAAKFAPFGFSRAAFYPCYGLAEATLFVTGPRFGTPPQARCVDAGALELGFVTYDAAADSGNASHAAAAGGRRPAAADGGRTRARTLVACGRTWSGAPLCIADPATRQPCAAGQIGEIWVAGPSVALGYWNDPERTAATFGAYTADGHGPYLRTGDLGFVVDGELFVTGRIKDVMIVSGRNHYPQDIELTASQSDPELMGRPAAAFLLPDEGEEAIALVHEVSKAFALRYARAPEVARLRQLESKIRNAVAREHGLALKRVVLVAQGQLPMTTSGKIRRATSQKLWLDKQLEQLGGESHSA